MTDLYPLRFKPIFRRYLWGGRRLGDDLNRPIGEGDDYAESWEVVDHGEDQSVVANGPLVGAVLKGLVRDYGPSLLGRHHPQSRFPLLLKFLDAQRNLSVQVHPNDELARQLDPPDLGKTEAWVILARQPGAKIYAGWKRGFDRPAIEREITRGTVELCLHQFEPQVGDCVLLPAGVVHAIGAGLLIAEIQQASDTTYRVYDWNRLGTDGRPRELHIDRALEAIDFDSGPVEPQTPQPTGNPACQRLASCEKFILDRWQIGVPCSIGGDERCHIVTVLIGAVSTADDPADRPLVRGETWLVPASLGPLLITPHGEVTLLDMYLP